MAFAPVFTPHFTFNAVDWTPYITALSFEETFENLTTTNADSVGSTESAKGLFSATLTVDLEHDDAAALDAILAAVHDRTAYAFVLRRSTDAASSTNPEWTGNAFLDNYTPPASATIGQIATYTASLTVTGAVTRATS